MAEGERKLAAIMFTDIVGYAALTQKNEALAMQLLADHNRVLRPFFPRHGGREVKTMGDSFLVEFSSALEAVRCAIAIQQHLRERNVSLSPDRRISIRIGIHAGDVIYSNGDIFGDAVNISSRIQPLAEPDGICISEQVYDQIHNKIELPLVKMEKQSLKNVNSPIDVYRIAISWEREITEPIHFDKKRIAVLPLKNMSPDPNDEYFADGMTEELITTLSGIGGLNVIARTSTMQYKGGSKRISEIAKELNAGTLVEGSVRRAANKVRITVQLIDAQNELHLWAQNYDKQFDDIFEIQSDIAKRVAKALRVHLLSKDIRNVENRPTQNPEAYELYLKGRYFWNKRTEEAITEAIAYFEKAIEKDPRYALGFSGLADCHYVLAVNAIADPPANFQKAKAYMMKALQIDDKLAEAHTTLAGIFEHLEYDLRRAEEEYRRAIELNPSYSTAHQWYFQLLLALDRWEEAYSEIKKAIDLDPLSPLMNLNLVFFYLGKRDYDAACNQCKKVEQIDPAFHFVHFVLGLVYCLKGMYNEALRQVEEYSKLTGQEARAKSLLAYVYASMGDSDKARRLLGELESQPTKEYVSSSFIGMIYIMLVDNDRGFQMFEKAYSNHEANFGLMLKHAQELDGVRSDPRYVSLLKKLGLE